MLRKEYSIEKEREVTVSQALRACEQLELCDAITLLQIFSSDRLQDIYSQFFAMPDAKEDDDKGLQSFYALQHLAEKHEAQKQTNFIKTLFYLSEDKLKEIVIALSRRIEHILANTAINWDSLKTLMRLNGFNKNDSF